MRGGEPVRLVAELGHSGGVNAVSLSPDGLTLLTGSADGTARIWDASNGHELRAFQTANARFVGAVNAVAFSPDGKFLLTGGDNAHLWDPASGREVRQFGVSDNVMAAVFSPDGRLVLTGSFRMGPSVDGAWDVRLWDVASGQEVQRFHGHTSEVISVAFSADGRFVLTGSGTHPPNGDSPDRDHTVRLWDVDTGNEIKKFEGHSSAVVAVAFSLDGRLVLSASRDKTVRVWDVSNAKEIRRFEVAGAGEVMSAAFSPDRQSVVTGSGQDAGAQFWNLANGQRIRRFEGHAGLVSSVAFSRKGDLITGSWDNTARLWNTATGKEVQRFEGHVQGLSSVEFSPEGCSILTTSRNGSAQLWNLDSGQMIGRFNGLLPFDYPTHTGVAFSPDGRFVLTGSGNHPWQTPHGKYDNDARLWDVASGQEVRRFKGHTSGVWSVAFSPDGKYVLTGSGRFPRFDPDQKADNTARLWDIGTGQELRKFEGHSAAVRSVAFSPDGQVILTGSDDESVRLWETQTGREIRKINKRYSGSQLVFSPDGKWVLDGTTIWDPIDGHILWGRQGILAAVFSRDGKLLLTGSTGGTATLIDVSTGQAIRQFKGPASGVWAVALSADGRFVSTGGQDNNTAILWDAGTGLEIQRFHANRVSSLAFSPDGEFLAVAAWDGDVQLYNTSIADKASDSTQPLAVLINFNEGGWAVIDPRIGRFDSNQLEQIAALHWVFSDEPFRALAPEVFMRDYYQPHLLPRLLARDKLEPIRDLASLNRVQPEIGEAQVQPEPGGAGLVTVRVPVRSAVSKRQVDSQGHFSQSGVYDLRLFRDGQLVGQMPNLTLENDQSNSAMKTEDERVQWRQQHQLLTTGERTVTIEHVRLPARQGMERVTFTAYAFNSDRVKSETSLPSVYQLQLRAEPVKRRAYLITMGVDANESQDPWRLDLAVSSTKRARALLRQKLKNDYQEIIEVPLLAELARDSAQVTSTRARKANLEAALRLLAGRRDVDPAVRQEIDPDHELMTATPDDAVVLYVASHGYADPQGTFYVIPYDTGTNWGVTEQDLNRCIDPRQPDHSGCHDAQDFLTHSISSADLAAWWRRVDAGELVMILDSCHSGALPGREFRAGPFGDRGFGQLSYDKGMRILVAAQPAQTAQGDWIGGGEGRTLLVEALEQAAASDPEQTLTEWMRAAVHLVPLNANRRYPTEHTSPVRCPARESEEANVQAPELMDFSRGTAGVTVANASSP
jgi:WD40 repeat protein